MSEVFVEELVVSLDVKTFVGVLVLDIMLPDVGMGVLVELLAAVGDGMLDGVLPGVVGAGVVGLLEFVVIAWHTSSV
jgi:hypothetical protein